MKYEENYPWYKRLFWDSVLLGMYHWYKVWNAIKSAVKELISNTRPKNPAVVEYAKFMRKRR